MCPFSVQPCARSSVFIALSSPALSQKEQIYSHVNCTMQQMQHILTFLPILLYFLYVFNIFDVFKIKIQPGVWSQDSLFSESYH